MIKENFKSLLSDTKGSAITVLLIFLLPVLLFMTISKTEQTRLMRATNVTLENAVEESARQAAMMVDPEAQSKGYPLISYNRAIPMLEEYLKTYLGLDDNLVSNDATSINSITYEAIIYNGATELTGYEYEDYFNDYYESNEIAYLVKLFNNGQITHLDVIENPGETEFMPKTFYISDDNGITDYEVENSIKVTMDSPGILLVVKAKVNPVIVNQESNDFKETVTRYAYAKIVIRE